MKHQLFYRVAKKAPRHSLFLLCFFILSSSLRAQNFIYAKGLNNPGPLGGNVVTRNIKVDNSGNTYVIGVFAGTADFDPGIGTYNLTSAGGNDIFIAKYDASGNYVYAKGMGSTGNDVGYGIVFDGSGNVFVIGNFAGIADFDPGAGIANLTSAGGNDIFIAKYDASGNYLYAKRMGGTGTDYGFGIAIDASGNTYITGSFTGTVDFDPNAGTVNLISAGSTDIFIARYDASGNYVYAKRMGGTGSELGFGIAVDCSGNTYITGNFSVTADFDPNAGTANLTSAGQNDIFVAKYDAFGNYVYAKAMGSIHADFGYGIAIDGLGNTYITGNFYGTADFDPGVGTINLTSNAVSNDIFVARYDASGNYVYAKAMGGTGADYGYGIVVDSSFNVYVTGYFIGTADFDPNAGTVNLVSAGSNEIFVARYDATGSYVYAKAMGGAGSDIASGIAIDRSGNAYTSGHFVNTADFDPGAGTANLTIEGTGTNAFISILSNVGNYVRVSQIGLYSNIAYADQGRSIATDASGNVYVTGYFAGTVDFDPGAGISNLTSAGSNDIFIAKYDATGNYIYAKTMGSTSGDLGLDIAVDALGNAYVTGYFSLTVDFDPGAGTANLTSAGGNDIFIAKYDPSGNYVYAKAMGGNNTDDVGYGIAVDTLGNIYVTGYFVGTADFDPGAGIASLTSAGSYDIFVAKYDASGNYVYAKAVGGTGDDFGYGIAIDGSGNAYITGYFAGTVDFNPGAGTANLTSAGGNDIFVASYDASGNYVYAKALGSTTNDIGYSIAVDTSHNVYVSGNFTGTADFDPDAGTANLTSAGGFDIFLAKYDASGNYVYAKAVGSTGGDYSYGIAIDGSGNAFITGYFAGTVDFDPGAGTSNLISAGNNDIYVARYDASGNYVYAKAMGGTGADFGFGIVVDVSDNAYVTGSFTGTADFDPGGGSASSIITALNSNDVFIAKYGPLIILPVNLVTFNAQPVRNGEAVQINWSTATQLNNDYFEVERSKDGVHFEAIGRRQGCSTCTGLQQYALIDNKPYSGLSYYHLKQVDNDNKISYSPIAKINIAKKENTTMHIYPIITEDACEILIKNNQHEKQVMIQLLNAAGSLVKEQTAWLNVGNNEFNYSLSNQARGLYFIRVADKKSNTVFTVKVIKK